MIVLNSRDQSGMYGMGFFTCLETNLTIDFSQKTNLNALAQL